MKKALFLLLIVLSLIFSLAFKKTTINNFPLFGKLIVLDPGHGGVDPGASYNDEYEKDYNLYFAKTLKKQLELSGATVVLTREGDYDLASSKTDRRKKNDFDNRIKMINDMKPDVYISLHMNYLNDSQYYGSQTFYSNVNEKNKVLADITQNNLNTYFNFNKNATKIDNDKYMYKNLNTVGILIEYGFISSPKDRNNLKKEYYRKELSEVISLSLIHYFT